MQAPMSDLARRMLADPETCRQLMLIIRAGCDGLLTFEGKTYRIAGARVADKTAEAGTRPRDK